MEKLDSDESPEEGKGAEIEETPVVLMSPRTREVEDLIFKRKKK